MTDNAKLADTLTDLPTADWSPYRALILRALRPNAAGQGDEPLHIPFPTRAEQEAMAYPNAAGQVLDGDDQDDSPYCSCDEQPTDDEMNTNTCASCGRQLI